MTWYTLNCYVGGEKGDDEREALIQLEEVIAVGPEVMQTTSLEGRKPAPHWKKEPICTVVIRGGAQFLVRPAEAEKLKSKLLDLGEPRCALCWEGRYHCARKADHPGPHETADGKNTFPR